jgi:hypothetical protein
MEVMHGYNTDALANRRRLFRELQLHGSVTLCTFDEPAFDLQADRRSV